MASMIEKRSVERIPVSERTTGFWAMFMLWTGFSISVARLWQGGAVTQTGFWYAVIALAISQIFWIGFVAVAFSLILHFFIKQIPLRTQHDYGDLDVPSTED